LKFLSIESGPQPETGTLPAKHAKGRKKKDFPFKFRVFSGQILWVAVTVRINTHHNRLSVKNKGVFPAGGSHAVYRINSTAT
jgi:hypothetical protein